jgi:hypothetical protein
METNVLTAKQLFEISKNNSINMVYEKILEEANNGKTYAEVRCYNFEFKKEIISFFENLGYKVEVRGAKLEIIWKDA